MATELKLKKNLKIFIYSFIGIAVLLTAAQIYAIEALYENDVYHFVNGTILPDMINYILVAVVIASLVLGFFSKKATIPTDMGQTSITTIIFSAATGLFALLGGMSSFGSLLGRSSETEMLMNTNTIRNETFEQIKTILSLVVFAYFMFTAFSVRKHTRAKIVMGTLTILWHIVFLLTIYFNMTLPLNAPLKIIFQFATLVSMLYMVYEIHFLVQTPKPQLYLSISLIAIVFLSVSSIPFLICTLTGKLAPTIGSVIYHLQQLSMLGYIISRLIKYINHTQIIPDSDKESDSKAEEITQSSIEE